MPLHLVKICVGATGVDSLAEWQQSLLARGAKRPFHETRMFPRRADEILDGGSLYWTISNRFSVRQRIVDISRNRGGDGVQRCRLSFDQELVPVEPLARRPFQGWRYLEQGDAPKDVSITEQRTIDQSLFNALADLGLL